MKTTHDTIGDLEAALFDGLGEAEALTRRLAVLTRTNRTVALALSEAHGKESSRLLCALMSAENLGPRRGRKKVSKGASRR